MEADTESVADTHEVKIVPSFEEENKGEVTPFEPSDEMFMGEELVTHEVYDAEGNATHFLTYPENTPDRFIVKI